MRVTSILHSFPSNLSLTYPSDHENSNHQNSFPHPFHHLLIMYPCLHVAPLILSSLFISLVSPFCFSVFLLHKLTPKRKSSTHGRDGSYRFNNVGHNYHGEGERKHINGPIKRNISDDKPQIIHPQGLCCF